jgi:6-pyruvoyltetrahydropterin/6-carboxytetrahydropterin synthase
VVAQKLHDEFVIDFAKLRQSMDTILQQVDHKDLNEILPFIPTCENLARYIHEQLSLIGKAQAEDRVQLFSVTIEEAKGNAVIYFSDTKEVVWRCPSIQEALTERN